MSNTNETTENYDMLEWHFTPETPRIANDCTSRDVIFVMLDHYFIGAYHELGRWFTSLDHKMLPEGVEITKWAYLPNL